VARMRERFGLGVGEEVRGDPPKRPGRNPNRDFGAGERPGRGKRRRRPTSCFWCASNKDLQTVTLERRATGERVDVELCAGCRTIEARTWRLTWTEVA
jgi:hypothetical protein